jgi:hypothetical protein
MTTESDKAKKSAPRREYFELEAESQAINSSIVEMLQALQRQAISQKLPEDNTLHYTHGKKWSNRTNPHAIDGGFQEHSVEWRTPFKDLVEGDLTLIPRFIQHTSEEFQRQVSTMIYSSIDKVTAMTGNIVSVKEAGSFPAAFLEMLGKIEFGVDKQGNASMPEIHTGTDPKKMIAELEAQPPEYQAKVERIKSEKMAAALAAEAARKSKFKVGKQ